MTVEYDLIANQYKTVKNLDYYTVMDNTFYKTVGDITNLNILDIGCGEGHSTRILKKMGCSKILGIDISKKMINLAKKVEQEKCMGLKYLCINALDIKKIQSFDLITVSLVLHYSKNKNELVRFVKNIFDNLKPNSRAIILNDAGIKENLNYDFTKYGLTIKPLKNDIDDATPFKVTILGKKHHVSFINYYYSRNTYNRIFERTGFSSVKWHDLSLPEEFKGTEKEAYWNDFIRISPNAVIEIFK